MSLIGGGIRSALSVSAAYSAAQALVGSARANAVLLDQYARPRAGERVLDIGCGPADILKAMPEGVDYLGLDENPRYIRSARRKFGHRGRFHCVDVREASLDGEADFDLAMAVGVLHHLDDDGARALVELALSALAEGGRFVTRDSAIEPGQHRAARWLIEQDRGSDVRTPEGYQELVRQRFRDVDVTVRHDLLRVPYTHAILECRRGSHRG